MPDFLLELRSEEIPARMQARAREDLARLFAGDLAKAGLSAAETLTYSTPRRLALIARGLPDATEAVREETKGPRAAAPPQAVEGFLRKTGLTREALVERDGVLFAVIDKPGRATAEVLAEAIPAIVRAFPWPKSMRWGAASISTESPRWVRPLQGIVALFDDQVVPIEIAGTTSSAATLGHRFHHPGAVTIGSAAGYVEKLRACHAIVDQAEREALIRARAAALAAEAGLALIADEGLVVENAGLTEWPVPLLGRFDADYLSVPPEVIQLTARVNQKYFVCRGADGELANAFICTANIDAVDGGAAIVEGNRKVLAARLSDARFFYEQDLKVPLEEQARKLDRIVFHEKLGSVADKVERVAKLARWLVEEGIVGGVTSSPAGGGGAREARDGGVSPLAEGGHPSTTSFAGGPPPPPGEDLAALAERAARLCKADLVTGMVGEFPELQGVMGGYYAAAQGEPRAVSDAIRDHYKPVGQGDDVPTAPVTVAVSLADKLDVVLEFYGSQQRPSGSKDPYAVRRATLGALEIIQTNELRVPFLKLGQWFFWWQVRQWNAKPGCRAYGWGRPFEIDLESEQGERVVAIERTFFDIELHADDLEELDDIEFVTAHNGNYHDDGSSDLDETVEAARAFVIPDWRVLRSEIVPFFADRLKVQQREAGVRHDLIDAVFAIGGEDDLVRLLASVRALQAFVATEDGANLLVGYRRAANILKKEGWTASADTTDRHPGPFGEAQDRLEPGSSAPQPMSPEEGWMPEQVRHDEEGSGAEAHQKPLSYTPLPEEYALIAALDSAVPRARAAVAAEEFQAAMTALASLRAPIDAFFDKVTVNDPDPAKREARLALLARVRDAVHEVADFSRIEG